MYLQKNLVILAITISLEINIMCFSIMPPSGHIKDLELKNEKNVRPFWPVTGHFVPGPFAPGHFVPVRSYLGNWYPGNSYLGHFVPRAFRTRAIGTQGISYLGLFVPGQLVPGHFIPRAFHTQTMYILQSLRKNVRFFIFSRFSIHILYFQFSQK